MATVYSLVCFGGLSGKTVTFTDAGDIVNLTNHGLRQGVTGVVFSTTGALPTGITAGTTYYPRDGADANKFTIYPTKADALAGTNQITFTGTGSGTHTVKSAYMLGLNSTQLARYGDSGSERIYNGLLAFQTARNYKPELGDIEVCEIGEDFTEIASTAVSCANLYNASAVRIESSVNGQRTYAFHNGSVSSGFLFECSSSASVINPNTYNLSFDGIRIKATYSGGTKIIQSGSTGFSTTIKNCIVEGNTSASTQIGVQVEDAFNFYNNIVFNVGGTGIYVNNGKGSIVCNNLITKCIKGLDASTTSQGYVHNNVVVGNAVNYEDSPRYYPTKLFNNVGEDIAADKVEFTASAGSSTLTFASAHYRNTMAIVVFDSSGTLPTVGGVALTKGKPYVVLSTPTSATMTISNNNSESAFTFDGPGSGTHTMTRVWCSSTPTLVDMTSPGSIFVDYANNDFRLANNSPLIDAGYDLAGIIESVDILGSIRPNYQASTYPDNYWDIGPFEYDHGDGLIPAFTELTITAQVSLSGAEVRIYDLDNNPAGTYGTELAGTESHSAATYTYTGSTGNVIGIQIMQSGYEEFNQTITLENDTQSLPVTLRSDINA